MSIKLTPANLSRFDTWLTAKRPLGLALAPTGMSIADASGSVWHLTGSDVDHWRTVLEMVAGSGRRVWGEMGSRVAVELSNRLAIDVQDFSWLHCATMAHRVVHPYSEWEVQVKDSTGKPAKMAGPTRKAAAVAGAMAELAASVEARTRQAVMTSSGYDQTFRRRQQLGWLLDMDFVVNESQRRRRMLAEETVRLGVNLDPESEGEKAQVHRWLAEVGIEIRDRKGELSLTRDEYDSAKVPPTDEASARWEAFRRVRSIASRLDKLRELRRAVHHNDRVYSTARVRGTRTGRSSFNGPALQNIAREHRHVLRASPGMQLVALDYSQIEPRVAAALSSDDQLRRDILDGDLYLQLAEFAWPEQDPTEHRSEAKVLLLSILYGKGRDTVALELHISEVEAGRLMDRVWLRYPKLRQFNEKLKAEAARGVAYVTTTGRPAPTPRSKSYAALNTAVQSEAADVMLAAAQRVVDAVGTDAMWLTIHDEVVIEVPANRTEWAKSTLNALMPVQFGPVPIGGEARVLGGAWRKPD